MADLIEECCFNEPRDGCAGHGCACGCHVAAPRQWTTQEKQEAFTAADRYFREMSQITDLPESLRQLASKPNPLFPIVYADAYLAGRQAERERHQSLRVAAKVILKRWDAVRSDEGTPIKALLPGLITIRAALRQAYGDQD